MKEIAKAVATLTIFSIITRGLSFVFKIYLSNVLGGTLLGKYQIALSIFFLLITITTSGVPLIVSKLTAKYISEKNLTGAHKVTTSAVIITSVLSLAITLLFLFSDGIIDTLSKNPDSAKMLKILLPAVFSASLYASFKGYIWGREQYKAVSVLEILEEITRIVVCVVMLSVGLDKLFSATLSLTISTFVSAILCIIVYFSSKGRLANPKGYIRPLLKSSIPITISRASSSIVNSIVAMLVPIMLIASGYSSEQALYLFGSSIGMAMPLLYIPITIIGSLAMVLVPTLSSMMAENDICSAAKQIEKSITFSIVIACIFIPIFAVMGNSIGVTLYNNADSGAFLTISCWLTIPLSLESITSSMMNSINLEKKSLLNFILGSVVMFVIMLAFYGNFSIGVLSLAMGVSFSFSTWLDIIAIKKKINIHFSFLVPLVKCALAIIPTTLLTYNIFTLLSFIPPLANLAISSVISACASGLVLIIIGVLDLSIIISRKSHAKCHNTNIL